jgi:hypothetical protein
VTKQLPVLAPVDFEYELVLVGGKLVCDIVVELGFAECIEIFLQLVAAILFMMPVFVRKPSNHAPASRQETSGLSAVIWNVGRALPATTAMWRAVPALHHLYPAHG